MDFENAGRFFPKNRIMYPFFLLEVPPYDDFINRTAVTKNIRVSSTRALTTDAIVASADLISKQYLVLPTCIPETPNGTMMKLASTHNHDTEKNATRYLLLLQTAQTRITKSRIMRGMVNGYNILMSRMYLQLPIGVTIERFNHELMQRVN